MKLHHSSLNQQPGLQHVSRRLFLKRGVVGIASLAVGLLVSACAGSASTSVPTAMLALASTNTPVPSSTPAPTKTSTPAVKNTNVASSSGKRLVDSKTFSTNDGRKIAYLEAGKPDGIPVVVLHGSPGCRLLYDPWVADATSRGIRLIGYDRPGYGDSTPLPGRSTAEAADDVAALAKQLDLRNLYVWGLSAGGPHALACAALLPDLVMAVAAIASPAPYKAEGLNWLYGFSNDNKNEFLTALRGRDALLQALAGVPHFYATTDPEAFYKGITLAPAEAAAFTREVSDFFLDYNREAVKAGMDGWVDDDISEITPWGFELSQIHIPVLIMQGEKDDFVPFSHGKWLAKNIKTATTNFITGEGHLAMLGHIPEVHAWLLSQKK